VTRRANEAAGPGRESGLALPWPIKYDLTKVFDFQYNLNMIFDCKYMSWRGQTCYEKTAADMLRVNFKNQINRARGGLLPQGAPTSSPQQRPDAASKGLLMRCALTGTSTLLRHALRPVILRPDSGPGRQRREGLR